MSVRLLQGGKYSYKILLKVYLFEQNKPTYQPWAFVIFPLYLFDQSLTLML